MEVKEEKQQGEEKKNRASHLWENILARSMVMDWGAGAKENSFKLRKIMDSDQITN